MSKTLHHCEFLRNSVQCAYNRPKQCSVSKTCSSLSLDQMFFLSKVFPFTPPSFLFIFSFAGTIFKTTSSFGKTTSWVALYLKVPCRHQVMVISLQKATKTRFFVFQIIFLLKTSLLANCAHQFDNFA